MAGRWQTAWKSILVALVLALVASLSASLPARAQTILRDPDIEHALKQLARPLIESAGLSPGRLKILVIKDDSMNAFVADHDHVFLHSGLILRLKTPAQLQGVIAHELAHIANGHLARRAANFQAARNVASMGTILAGVAAAAGGGRSAAGIALGVQSSALRSFLSHTRAEEASADQSALRYMVAHGIDPHGMAEVMELFRGQEVLSAGRRDPYLMTHPLSRDRFRAIEGFAAGHADRTRDRPEDAYWFARAQGKLSAFIRPSATTFRAVGRKPGQGDLVARMRRAVAFHRQPKPARAIAEIQALVAAYPNDAYLAELQGQILLENRQFGAAVQAYRRASQKAPSNGLILAGYGRALLALNTGAANAEALRVLTKARTRDPYSPLMLRDLGLAYARAGNNGMATLMSAERYALIGRLKDAVPHAKRAQGLLPRGSSGWNRAQDILTAARALSN